ncbi:gamma-tubulin complex, component 3 [Suillus lakei]|nr:gamma-tubulin complex, component 3 [Suillus lakei]
MRDVSASIESLVTSLVPQTQSNSRLKEELIAHCKDILASNIGTAHENDTGHLAAQIKRHPMHRFKFTNLLSRLLDQPVLSRKPESLLFLYSLASSPRQPASILPTFPAPHSRRATRKQKYCVNIALVPVCVPLSPACETKCSSADEGRHHLPEHLLLRDTLYLLQGISGKYVHLSLSDKDAQPKLVFVEDSKYIIPPPTKSLIHRLSEVGHLYARIAAFVSTQDRPSVGMIEQSLCHHLQMLLTEYYRLIAVLESQMGNAPNSAPGSQSNSVGEETEWRLRMRMMSVCVEGAHDAQGGALVNLIHSYTDNGDPFVRKFTDQLLEEVSTPFFNTLHKWLFSGELYDPHSEFFVSVDPSLAHLQGLHPSSLAGGIDAFGEDSVSADRSDSGGGLRVWEAKYHFRKEMLPMFVGENFGRKIFSTGKSLNFIRYSCHDSDWVATREKMSNTGGILKYSDIAGLERSIDSAYNTASARLFEVFTEKFRLLDHLSALKHYLLLGYGDFAEQLMESLGPSLARPANTLYRHNLTATLETAIRTSSAQNDPPDVLRRLDARMLEYTHGELGWDVFTLEYKVDAPLDTLLDPGSLEKYKRVFAHLWAMKRVEGALSSGWMRVAGAGRVGGRLEELEYDWHQIRITTSEMIHFIRQMQAYTQLEVIECSWKALIEFFAKREGDLDAMIDAHQSYLDRMVKKVLLISPKAGREESLLTQVREVFSTILQFREAIDNFYNYTLSESARLDQARDAARGVYSAPASSAHSQSLSQIRKLLREYSTAFSERMQTIVLALQSHPDLDCRFLGIRLSFSEFYRSKKDREVLATQRS